MPAVLRSHRAGRAIEDPRRPPGEPSRLCPLGDLALNNVKDLQDDLGAANVSVEIVAYGPGIGTLELDAVSNSRVAGALKTGAQTPPARTQCAAGSWRGPLRIRT